MRLARFREAHSRVVIGAGRGWWQAVIPEVNGEQVITRYTLRELLDKLDELTGGGLYTRTSEESPNTLSKSARLGPAWVKRVRDLGCPF